MLFPGMLVVIVFTATSLMAGCTKPAPAPEPSSSPASTPASTEVIKLKFATNTSPTSPSHQYRMDWIKRVEEETNGRVDITMYPSESLVKEDDTYLSVVGGICDIAFVSVLFETGQWGLNNVLHQEAVSPPTDERGNLIWDELWNKFPEMRAEYGDVKVLWKFISGGNSLQTTGKEIRVPGDMTGMKIITGSSGIRIMQETNCSPVDLPAPEWYMALERKLGEGLYTYHYVMDLFGCTELLPYHLKLGLGSSAMLHIMNLDRWNSLPPDIQKIIEDLEPWITAETLRVGHQMDADVWDKCRELGHTIVEPTPEELSQWQELARPAAEDWIKENEKRGKPARAVFEEAMRLVKEYKK